MPVISILSVWSGEHYLKFVGRNLPAFLRIPVRQLLEEFFYILWGNEQFIDLLREPVQTFRGHQQPIRHIPRACEQIPALILLVDAFLDSADLPEGQEQAIVDMTRNEVDADPPVCDDVRNRRAEEARVVVKKRKPDNQGE